MPTQKESDKSYIDKLIRQFFDLFTNKNRLELNLDLIFQLCIPETIIVKKTGLEQTVYNLTDFIGPRKKILTDGTLTDFEEFEIEEQTIIHHNIAQRRSRYQKTGYLNNKFFSSYGAKFFHIIRTVNGWQISSVVWEDDDA